MSTLRIAVAMPQPPVWSETFIRAHLDRLSDVVLQLTGRPVPDRDGQGAFLLRPSLADRLLRRHRTGNEHALEQAIAERLRSERVDVVLAEYGHIGHAMIGPCRAAGIPLVVHFHGFDAFHMKKLEQTGNYRELARAAAGVVVVSREMEAQLRALGVPGDRLHYICYGIDLGRFAPIERPATVARFTAVGRFTDKKAPHLTLLAFARALQRTPGLELVLVGDGPLREACIQLARALGVDHAVRFPGVMAPEEVSETLSGSLAFVQHSVITSDGDREGTPLAVLEAMARGLPVVATRHAGIADVVEHGVSGLLSEERDLDTMADHLVRIAGDAEAAFRMGRCGRQRVERRHEVGRQVAELQQVLARAVTNGRST